MPDTDLSPGRIAEPSVSNALRQGWEALKRNFWILVGIAVVYLVAQAIGSIFNPTAAPGEAMTGMDALLGAVNGLYGVLILAPLSAGVYFAFLHAVRGEAPRFDDLLEGFRHYVSVVVGLLLFTIGTAIGFALLVVPGVILLVRWSFTPLLLVDKQMGPVEALKESWNRTRGHGWSLFGLLLAAIGILIVGALLLGVGLLVALPLVMAAYAAFYHDVMDRPTVPAGEGPEAPAGAVGV